MHIPLYEIAMKRLVVIMSNRGEIKWAPFESLFRVQDVLSKLETNRKKAIKPVLSEDELQAIEATLLEAFHTKSCVLIHYYYEGLSYQKKGIVENIFQKRIFFQDHSSLYFEQIIHVSII